MTSGGRNQSIVVLHYTTGLVLLYLSLRTAIHAFGGGGSRHGAVLGAVEALGAVLFLVPRTLGIGALLLLLTLGAAIVMHGLGGAFRGDLLVFAAAVWCVLANRGGT